MTSSIAHTAKHLPAGTFHAVSYLVDLILCGLQRLDDGLQLDLASSQALLQLTLLLLQPAQVGLRPAQLFLLALQV